MRVEAGAQHDRNKAKKFPVRSNNRGGGGVSKQKHNGFGNGQLDNHAQCFVGEQEAAGDQNAPLRRRQHQSKISNILT